MVSIGRPRGRGPLINRPNNTGRASQANARLNHLAAAHAQKYTNALAVDGTPLYIWRKLKGSIPCTCSAAPRVEPYRVELDPLDDEDRDWNVRTGSTVGDVNETSTSRWTPYTSTSLPEFSFEPPKASLPERINVARDNAPQLQPLDDDDFDDSLDIALQRGEPAAGGAGASNAGFNDPFSLFNGKIIECPVCLGTGYLDAWQLHNGARAIFETGDEHRFRCDGMDPDDSLNPTVIDVRVSNATAMWTYPMPLTWNHILRARVYNRNERIDTGRYTWTWTRDNGDTGEVSDAGLEPMRNVGGAVTLTLTALEPFQWTHCELVFSYAEVLYAQFPEIDQVHEEEFLDWNITLQVEFPLVDGFKEGDYICEGRYRKAWKVNRIARKVTSDGTLYALTGEVRALHTFERLAEQLNLFRDTTSVQAIRARTSAVQSTAPQPTPSGVPALVLGDIDW